MEVALAHSRVATLKDNILKKTDEPNITCFNSIEEFIHQSELQKVNYDRLIFSVSIEEELHDLRRFTDSFASNMELVMLVNREGTLGVQEFKRVFPSPVYVAVYPENRGTFFSDIVKDSPMVLESKYIKTTTKPYTKLKNSGGFMNGIFGKSKNHPKSKEVISGNSDTDLEVSNVDKFTSKNDVKSANPNSLSKVENVGTFVSDVGSSQNSGTMELNFSGSKGIVEGVENLGMDNLFGNDMSDALSLGDMGEEHTDTGFLDSSEEAEIEQAKMSFEGTSEVSSSGVDRENVRWCNDSEMETPEEQDSFSIEDLNNMFEEEENEGYEVDSKVYEEVSNKVVENNIESYEGTNESYYPDSTMGTNVENNIGNESKGVDMNINKMSNGAVYILQKGVNIDTTILENVISFKEKFGSKPLIVSVDDEYELLSYVDTAEFYEQGYEHSLERGTIFKDENFDLLSNGYGVSNEDIDLYSIYSTYKDDYGLVIFLLKSDNLSSLSEKLLTKLKLKIYTNSDYTSFITNSYYFTDRSMVSLEVERLLMKPDKVVLCKGNPIEEVPKKDIEDIYNDCLFINGFWLKGLL